MNLHPFKLHRVHLDPLNLSDIERAFSLTWPASMKNLLEQKKAFA